MRALSPVRPVPKKAIDPHRRPALRQVGRLSCTVGHRGRVGVVEETQGLEDLVPLLPVVSNQSHNSRGIDLAVWNQACQASKDRSWLAMQAFTKIGVKEVGARFLQRVLPSHGAQSRRPAPFCGTRSQGRHSTLLLGCWPHR